MAAFLNGSERGVPLARKFFQKTNSLRSLGL